MKTCQQCKNSHWNVKTRSRNGYGDGECCASLPQWVDWAGSPIIDFDTDATRCDSFEQIESNEK